MPIAPIPFIGSGTQSQGIQLNPSQLINLYETKSLGVDAAVSKSALIRTPGTYLKFTTPNQSSVRGWLVYNNVLYLAAGTSFYSCTTAGVFTSLGTIDNVTVGGLSPRVSIVNNGFQIVIDTGTTAYTYTISGGAFATISDGDFTSTGFLTYQNNKVIYAMTTNNKVYVSDLNDATSWAATAFGSTGTDSNPLVCAFATLSNLLVFGVNNTEVWDDQGTAGFPYAPRIGVNIPYGCAARYSVCYTNGTVIWLSKNPQGKAMLIGLGYSASFNAVGGFSPQNLLDEAGTYQLQQLDTISDAKAATFQLNGHIFYALFFPTENKSFLFDTQTQKFIQWKSWHLDGVDVEGNNVYTLGRHLADDIIYFNGETLIADYRTGGNILVLDPNTYTEYNAGTTNTIYAECISPNINALGARITVNSIELNVERGTSIYSLADVEADSSLNAPILEVALSKDGGRTFSYIRRAELGYSGQYNNRVKLYAWGEFRQGALRLSSDHPSFISVYNVWGDVEVEGVTRG